MSGEWLNLSEAAELLGVHPSTVRQWADRGELPAQRTAGGHRRFRRDDVEGSAMARATGRVAARMTVQERSYHAGMHLIIQNMAGRARLELVEGALQGEAWYHYLDEPARQELGQIGHRLLNLMQRYLAADEPVEPLLAEAREIGRQYHRLGRDKGLSLVDITRAYLHFREFLAETIYDMALTAGAQNFTDWAELRRRLIQPANEVLLALIEAAEEPE
jgi:excisionase family DNA binding protein